MTSLFIITGFLGSGKTTLLKNILNNMGSRYRIAIIQNEFAPSGIDGKELRLTGKPFLLKEINNGSVFCVCQLGNFIETLQNISNDYAPDLIFLETSGMADPINIAEIVQDDKISTTVNLRHIYTVTDAVNFGRMAEHMPRLRHQVRVADTVIINKTDLVRNGIDDLKEKILDINPECRIITTSFAQIGFSEEFTEPGVNSKIPFSIDEISLPAPEIKTCVLRTHNKISESNLYAFVSELILHCYRIKGFINLDDGRVICIQSTFGQQKYTEVRAEPITTELVVFGKDITPATLLQTYKKWSA